ncbi:peptide ABC transporter permease [Microvirga sp. W0021]|uniref:Peptide ABC transporter permease n=1 Tax=Hohaiivirga grylli TaxID=3133970 RepID=A0ABV0BIU7_9HYPH
MKSGTRPFNPIIGDQVTLSALLLRRIAFILLFLILPIANIIGRRALVIILPVTVILLLIASVLDGQSRPLWQNIKRLMGSYGSICAVLLIIWCAVSLLWSPFPDDGSNRLLTSLMTIGIAFLAYLALPSRMRSSNLYLLPIGVAIAALVAIGTKYSFPNLASKNSSEVLERGMTILVLFFWPSVMWLRSRHRDIYSLLLTVIMLVSLYLVNFPIISLAFAVGALGYALMSISAQKSTRFIAYTVAGLCALAPLLPFILQPLAHLLGAHDLQVSMQATKALILSDPSQLITGQGLEAVRGRFTGAVSPYTPGTAIFQLWYELGILGGLGTAVIVYVATMKIGKAPAPLAQGVIASLLSAFTFAMVGDSLIQSWWITALCSLALIFVAITRGQFRTTRPRIFIVR